MLGMKIKSEITAPVKVKYVYPGVNIYIRIRVSKHIDQKLIFKKYLKTCQVSSQEPIQASRL